MPDNVPQIKILRCGGGNERGKARKALNRPFCGRKAVSPLIRALWEDRPRPAPRSRQSAARWRISPLLNLPQQSACAKKIMNLQLPPPPLPPMLAVLKDRAVADGGG